MPTPRPFAPPRDHHDARRDAKKRERAAAVAAFEAMCAARPLRPPPFPERVRTPTAGERAAAKDRRIGLIGGSAPFLDDIDGGEGE